MNCIIIEDELPAQRIIKSYISKLKHLQLVGTYQTALAANSVLSNGGIDLLFLDINLPDISGIDFIKTLSNSPKIIITTAYSNFAAESFEHWTIQDYLVKPFSFERFLKAMNKVEHGSKTIVPEEKKIDNIINLKIDKTLHRLSTNDILYIESDRNYITVITKTGKFTYIDSLKNWEEKLPPNLFTQTHKSYLVKLSAIDKISGNILYINDSKIPIGRKYKFNLLEKIRA